jgi:hypothetical protein
MILLRAIKLRRIRPNRCPAAPGCRLDLSRHEGEPAGGRSCPAAGGSGRRPAATLGCVASHALSVGPGLTSAALAVEMRPMRRAARCLRQLPEHGRTEPPYGTRRTGRSVAFAESGAGIGRSAGPRAYRLKPRIHAIDGGNRGPDSKKPRVPFGSRALPREPPSGDRALRIVASDSPVHPWSIRCRCGRLAAFQPRAKLTR